MTGPRLAVGAITIASSAPRKLAHFYADLLGWRINAEEGPRPGHAPEDGWAQIQPPEGVAEPTLNFEYDDHYARPVWPSRAGEQTASQHLDIGVDDLDTAVAWAIERGAELAPDQPQAHVRVMFDPDGHPFCLC